MPRKNVLKKSDKNRPVPGSSWTRDQLELLIEELKHRPELYGTRTNFPQTKRSLLELIKILKPHRPNVNIEDIKSHIRAIRDQYYREVARLEKNKKMGITDDTPRLWCFSKLTFLSEKTCSLEDSDADDGLNSARSTSPVSDLKQGRHDESKQDDEEDEEEEVKNENWAQDFLRRYLEVKETKSSEHKAFLKFVKSQLKQITNYDILSRTKLGMLQELETGFRQQKENEEGSITNGNSSSLSLNDKYDDEDDLMDD